MKQFNFIKSLSLIIGLLFVASSGYAAIGAADVGQKIDDAAITATIKAKYAKDSLVSPFNIAVSTNNGRVVLTGKVDSGTQFQRAAMLANATDGVKDVDTSALSIKDSKRLVSDLLITAKIKALLIKNKILDPHSVQYWPVKVETNNGVVYLTGTVNKEIQRIKIINLAKSVEGIKNIKEDIKVKSDAKS